MIGHFSNAFREGALFASGMNESESRKTKKSNN
jgi:hypothetical protein